MDLMTPRVAGRAVLVAGWIALSCVVLVAAPTVSPDDETPRRPRVGLVLAGGGARGIAHVGVIRLLEELNIRVDYVTGTSMGSIVGGLYAAGYNSREMLEWVNRCDWDVLLSDLPARQDRGYRAKEEELETPRWIEFGIGRSGLKAPNALVSGQNLLFALRDQTSLVASIDSFDDLPVPFRAVATDVETGDMVVLAHGPLADAMRASMAVPGMFAPHTIDGRVLIDGFASRNLPISVARDLGADVIIAVDVRADLKRAEELGNPLAMVNQLMSILSQKDTIEQIASLTGNDVLVRLKLPGYSTSSFRDGADLVELGYAEAQDMRAALAKFSVGAEAYAASERVRRERLHRAPVIAAIEVDAGSRVAESAVRTRLDLSVGQPLDQATLERSLQRVYDLGYFELVDHRIERRPTGDVLVVSAREKPWGPNFAIFGLGFRSDLDGKSELDVKASLRFTQLNRLGGELAVRGSVGSIDQLKAELFQPVEYTGQFFIAPTADYLKKPERFIDEISDELPGAGPLVLDFSRRSAFAGLDAGVRFGRYGEFRFGYARGSIAYSDVRGPLIILVGPDGEFTVLDFASLLEDYTTDRWTAALTLDRLDDAFFPRRGYYVNAYSDMETGSLGSTTAGLFATAPRRFGGWVVQPHVNANYTLDSAEDSGRLPFRVGGLFNLSGLAPDEVYGMNSFVGGVIVRKQLNEKGSLFVGGSLEAGNAWDETDDALPNSWIVSTSLFLAAKTPIGPLHLATGLADGRDVALYLYLGRVLPPDDGR